MISCRQIPTADIASPSKLAQLPFEEALGDLFQIERST